MMDVVDGEGLQGLQAQLALDTLKGRQHNFGGGTAGIAGQEMAAEEEVEGQGHLRACACACVCVCVYERGGKIWLLRRKWKGRGTCVCMGV